MQTPAMHVLRTEAVRLQKDPPPGITAQPTDSMFIWNAVIMGPIDSPFENGIFKLEFELTQDFPLRPPKSIRFITKMFHPNIYSDGRICLDVLGGQKWTPELKVYGMLQCIQGLLSLPNPKSPANREAADLYTTNTTEFENKVKETVKASAMFSHEMKYYLL